MCAKCDESALWSSLCWAIVDIVAVLLLPERTWGSHLQITLSYAATLLFSLWLSAERTAASFKTTTRSFHWNAVLKLFLSSSLCSDSPSISLLGQNHFIWLQLWSVRYKARSRGTICILRYSQHIESSTATYIFPSIFASATPVFKQCESWDGGGESASIFHFYCSKNLPQHSSSSSRYLLSQQSKSPSSPPCGPFSPS